MAKKLSFFIFILCMTVSSLGFCLTDPKVPSQKSVLICGAGGFIGHHLVKRYKQEGYWVRGVDIKYPEFEETTADEFIVADLRSFQNAEKAVELEGGFDEVCQLAANMGGMGFI